MNHQVTHDPAFAMLRVDLHPGERLVSEAGAMVAMSKHVNLEAKLTTSAAPGIGANLQALFAAVVRKYLGGESFFVSHYTATSPASVWLAPKVSGSIVHHPLQGQSITLSSGAFVASMGDISALLKQLGIADKVDVSPLFETESALEHGGRFLDELLAEEIYRDYARSRGRAVLFSTHHMSEVELLADRVGILAGGRLVEEGTADEIVARSGQPNLARAFLHIAREAA